MTRKLAAESLRDLLARIRRLWERRTRPPLFPNSALDLPAFAFAFD